MTDHSAQLASEGIEQSFIADFVDRVISEDLGGGMDVTTLSTVPSSQRSVLDFVARASGVISGAPVAAAVLEHTGNVDVVIHQPDGSQVEPGDVVLSATGKTVDLLTSERSALNILTHLSGVATQTRAWADALGDTGTKVRDTRKTIPGLRLLEKYAVRCGGGVNHRMFLSDAALVKDNHIVAAGGVAEAFAAVRQRYPDITVEVEVDNLDQLQEVVEAGADLVLLDNFTPSQMREAVDLVQGRALLEASGGLTLADAPAVGSTGVDYVAVGALTHSAPVLDIGADLRELP